MPQKRQLPSPVDETSILVRSVGFGLPSGYLIERHTHDWHQLIYATDGVMTVETASGSWVVPPQRAVWIPAGFEHAIRMTGRVKMRTLYLRQDLSATLPIECGVIHVKPLLRELIVEIVRLQMLLSSVEAHVHLSAVLVDCIVETPEPAVRIQLPTDPRARRAAELARSDLATAHRLAQLAKDSGASVRTLERLFVQETGLTFGRWLRRVRALHALERLGAGDSVTEAGLAVGYDSTSAFIAMFKSVLGTTPGQYFVRRAS